MLKIKLVQHADEQKILFFTQYVDDTHRFISLEDDGLEADQLRSWIQAGNPVEPYSPIISGGIIPVATILWFCSPRPPEGYLLCDGSAVPRAKYVRLFEAIGETYGTGDGQTTFNLPDLAGRFCRGWAQGGPLDPDRTFGSYQEDEPGRHSHGLQTIFHTHTITDPGHIHGVTDPGHIHDIVDPGHVHSVTDNGHQHLLPDFSHVGYAGAYDIFFNGALQFGSGGVYSGRYDYYISEAMANMNVAKGLANLFLDTAQANVIAGEAVTNISIDVATTNITHTEQAGTGETRPENIALLPVIRY